MDKQTDFLRKNINESMFDILFQAMSNLSMVLGDFQGKVSIPLARKVTMGYTVGASGSINRPTLVITGYEDIVSVASYNKFKLLVGRDKGIVITTDTRITTTSPLVEYSKTLTFELQSLVGSIYVELLSTYLGIINSTYLSDITRQDITRLDANLRLLTEYLEGFGYPPYELIRLLRGVQRTMAYIKTIDTLFIKPYESKLQMLEAFMEGVEYEL